MSTARAREVRKQNRLLLRQEAVTERDVAAAIRSMAEPAARAYLAGGVAACMDAVDAHARPAIERALALRLRQTSLLFGGHLLDRMDQLLTPSKMIRHPRAGVMRTLFPEWEAKGFRDVFEAAIQSWVSGHALRRAVTITGTLKDAVRGVIGQAQEDGTGEAGTAKAIVELVGNVLSRVNAARIARTEAHTAASVGADEAARATGLDMVKEWAAVEDKRTRLSHAVADGQTVDMNADFEVGGEHLRFPGDPDASAREIVNCRCVPLYHPRIGGEIIR